MTSFASLASGTADGFAFGKKTDSPFSFSGAGTSVFKPSPSKEQQQHDDSGAVAEDDGHDPHFEPIVPLPELVKVTTGEEDEEVLFKHRAKVFRCVMQTWYFLSHVIYIPTIHIMHSIFRFDPDTKQWKERGIGDIKILKNPSKHTYRVLLRRDQIHKIACNHLIKPEMELEPMFGSETAVCWFAMDYADEEPKVEKLAVRFKLAETKDDFKKVFMDCQEKLRKKTGAPAAGSAVETAVATPAAVT